MTGNERDAEDEVRVVVPDEAPVLTPGAAGLLLQIVREAQTPPESDVEFGLEAA